MKKATRKTRKKPRRILVIDVGGSHVKLCIDADGEVLRFDSGPKMGPAQMVRRIRKLTSDWRYDAISIGFPGLVFHGRITAEPHNLGRGWVRYDFAKVFGVPVRVINDAAMQAIGSYEGGRMLFLGLGTGLGATLILNGVVEPMEIGHMPYRHGRTFEQYVGERGLEKYGLKKWRKLVTEVVDQLRTVLEVDYVVLGGGNARKVKQLPKRTRRGDNLNAFTGGLKLWYETDGDELILRGAGSMPFTLAHPAAVMPLRRLKFLQPQALIIGSMMPDLPYFFPVWFLSRFFQKLRYAHLRRLISTGHPSRVDRSMRRAAARHPFTALLPDRAKWICLDAAERFTARPLNWLLAIPSILIGAWTHIFWDSFTHDGGWVVQRVDALRAWVSVFGYTGQVCHILQYISSVAGLIVLAYWYYLATKEAPHDYGPRALSRPRRLQLLGLVVLVGAVIGVIQAIHAHDDSRSTIYGWEYLILTRWVAWWGLLFFIAGTIVTLADRAHVARIKSAQEAEHA